MANNRKLIGAYENYQDMSTNNRIAQNVLESALRYYGINDLYENPRSDFQHSENRAGQLLRFYMQGKNIGFNYMYTYEILGRNRGDSLADDLHLKIKDQIYKNIVEKIEKSDYFQELIEKNARQNDRDGVISILREENSRLKTLLMRKEQEVEVLNEQLTKSWAKSKPSR